MSSALSSVRTRRTQQPQPQPQSQGQMLPQPQSQSPYNPVPVASGPGTVTLQQVIEIYGKRINTLETLVQQVDVKKAGVGVTLSQVNDLMESKLKNVGGIATTTDEMVKEWDARFVLFAQELADLKDIVLHLQDYTMTVNKTLLNSLGATPPQNMSTTNVDFTSTSFGGGILNSFGYTEEEEKEEEDKGGEEKEEEEGNDEDKF